MTRYSCSTRYKGSSVYILRKNFLWDLEMELIIFTASIQSGNDRRCDVILCSEKSGWPAVLFCCSQEIPIITRAHLLLNSEKMATFRLPFSLSTRSLVEGRARSQLRTVGECKIRRRKQVIDSNVLQSLASCLVWIATIFQ